MIVFMLFILIQFGVMFFLNQLGVCSDINAYIFIFINMMYLVIIFLKKYRDISKILLIGYFVRIMFLLWDIYAKKIFIFPGSGGDTEGFYISALLISKNLKLLKEEIYGGVYSKILGIIYFIVGENRIIGQYINVLLGIGIILLVCKILKLLKVNRQNINIAILFLALFPNSLIYSAILLRENFISFFIILSVYFFIKWYLEGSVKNQTLSIITILIASSFHSGVIGILIGYILTYVFYDKENNKYKLSVKSLSLLVIFLSIVSFMMSKTDLFLNKFSNVEDVSDVLNISNYRTGGSQYLTYLRADTWWEMILYSPIKMIYFLGSPLPWNWRGLGDILTFVTDSFYYVYFSYIILKNIGEVKKCKENKVIGLFISIFITIFIFGIGVSNAGTAMRHRYKIIPVILVLYMIIVSKGEYKNER